MSDAAVLQRYLDEAIPLVVAMGVRVTTASETEVVLHAPLAPNLNHQRTAFGGSVASIATLACWGWLWNHLRKPSAVGVDAQLVVARAEVDYLKPLTTELIARCVAPATDARVAFESAFARRGRGRLTLIAEVSDAGGQVCARFTGQFVALGGT